MRRKKSPTTDMNGLPLPRFIEAASIQEGDTIRATWNVGAIEHSRTAVVGRVRSRTVYAEDGQELFSYGAVPARFRVTLLALAKAEEPETLPGLEIAS